MALHRPNGYSKKAIWRHFKVYLNPSASYRKLYRALGVIQLNHINDRLRLPYNTIPVINRLREIKKSELKFHARKRRGIPKWCSFLERRVAWSEEV